jgi:hypothetical protein
MKLVSYGGVQKTMTDLNNKRKDRDTGTIKDSII